MGLLRNRYASFSTQEKNPPLLPIPNPREFRILRSEKIGSGLVVEVFYPDCTNFEGRKILVYHEVTLKELLAQGSIDPHFCENSQYHSPIARFEPTGDGWALAIQVAGILGEKGPKTSNIRIDEERK